MKNKLPILIVVVFTLFSQASIFALLTIDQLPSETIVLKLPNHDCSNWKEIYRDVTKSEGVVERIPSNQTAQNWSELICIQYFGMSVLKEGIDISVESMVDRIGKATYSLHPGNKVTWRIIEKHENDIIYEWILHAPHENTPAQHEVSRAFLTESGFHRIGVTRKNVEMSSNERAEWIRILKESAFVVSIQEADSIEGLSMVNKPKYSLGLEGKVQSWTTIDTPCSENGHAAIAQNSSKKETGVLEQSSTETIYSQSHPQDRLQTKAVVKITGF